MKNRSGLSVAAFLFAVSHLTAATHYVDIGSTNAAPPYTNWITAATNLQQAVDAAAAGDEVLVTDGIYGAVTVGKALAVRSQYGPAFTVIDAGGNSRCAWLTNGASLSGFWLRHGTADIGAGVFCASSDVVLTNCIIRNNSALSLSDPNIGQGGGVYGGTLYNCALNANSAIQVGGGAYSNTLYDCILTDNRAVNTSSTGGAVSRCQLSRCTLLRNASVAGGGAAYSTLSNCTLNNNTASSEGGGAYSSTLSNCGLTGNSASSCGAGATDSTLYSCSVVSNSVPQWATAASGAGAFHCTLSNCLVSGNSLGGTNSEGGGAYYSSLCNCIISSNWSFWQAGGAFFCQLTNCLLIGNSAGTYVGGARGDNTTWLWQCTVVGNSSGSYGGVYGGAACNSVIYSNTAASGVANYWGTALTSCCTMPMPASGTGNITNAPLFVNPATGDFRLLGTSPGINAGNNAYVGTNADLAGNPRIVGASVDMGAYEFQGTNSTAFYSWLWTNGVTADGLTDYLDADRDGMNNWQEWVCGTCPTNAASALRLLSATPVGSDVCVRWQSVPGVKYQLLRTANLASPFTAVATNLTGLPGETACTDTNAATGGRWFYRAGVDFP